jgi:O-acetyl-ADP-ribose deacetylase (regulator of RNase III)
MIASEMSSSAVVIINGMSRTRSKMSTRTKRKNTTPVAALFERLNRAWALSLRGLRMKAISADMLRYLMNSLKKKAKTSVRMERITKRITRVCFSH